MAGALRRWLTFAAILEKKMSVYGTACVLVFLSPCCDIYTTYLPTTYVIVGEDERKRGGKARAQLAALLNARPWFFFSFLALHDTLL